MHVGVRGITQKHQAAANTPGATACRICRMYTQSHYLCPFQANLRIEPHDSAHTQAVTTCPILVDVEIVLAGRGVTGFEGAGVYNSTILIASPG